MVALKIQEKTNTDTPMGALKQISKRQTNVVVEYANFKDDGQASVSIYVAYELVRCGIHERDVAASVGNAKYIFPQQSV
jgi:hypothetical protein